MKVAHVAISPSDIEPDGLRRHIIDLVEDSTAAPEEMLRRIVVRREDFNAQATKFLKTFYTAQSVTSGPRLRGLDPSIVILNIPEFENVLSAEKSFLRPMNSDDVTTCQHATAAFAKLFKEKQQKRPGASTASVLLSMAKAKEFYKQTRQCLFEYVRICYVGDDENAGRAGCESDGSEEGEIKSDFEMSDGSEGTLLPVRVLLRFFS